MDKWNHDNSITDTELTLAAKKGRVTKVTITEIKEAGGFYVTMRVKPEKEIILLTTRRVRDQPRVFMNLGRLVSYIRQKIAPLSEVRLCLSSNKEKEEISRKERKANKP